MNSLPGLWAAFSLVFGTFAFVDSAAIFVAEVIRGIETDDQRIDRTFASAS